MPKQTKRYRNLSMPAEFIADIERFIKEHPEEGFTSMSEFAKRAMWLYMKSIKEKNNKKK